MGDLYGVLAKSKEPQFDYDRESIEQIVEEIQERISNDEKITLRRLWNFFGFDCPENPDGSPNEYDLYGYDKRGFRKLYEYKLVPIDD